MGKCFLSLLCMVLQTGIALAEESNMSTQAIEQRIKPIGQVQIGAPPTATATTTVPATTTTKTAISQQPSTAPTTATTPPIATPSAETPVAKQPGIAAQTQANAEGEKIYKTYCFACHASGLAGSPKFGDVAAWAPRIKQGIDTLVSHAINGYKVMPPKGTCISCTKEQITAAVKYMISNSQKK
jgi:cytochrome c5